MPSSKTLTILFTLSLLMHFRTFSKSLASSSSFSDQSLITIPTNRMEKTTKLHFFFHDTITGKNPSTKPIAGPPLGFGTTFMMDDPLTEEQDPASKLVGRAQGMYAMASQEDIGLLMVVNYAFVGSGPYNGSSISVLGRNPVMERVREMPVVGGSGAFRFARGFALARTVWSNGKGDAIVEYNVTVVHF